MPQRSFENKYTSAADFYKKGFTLVEIAICVVIVGILTIVVAAGSGLIKSSQAVTLIAEMEHYKSAITAFTLRHNALPGDFTGAYNLWGNVPSQCISAINCNGNGNGKIEWNAVDNQDEGLKAWIHLVLDNTIQGSYTGISGNGVAQLGVNVPMSKNQGGWVIDYSDNSPTAYGMSFSGNNLLLYGNPSSPQVIAPFLSPEDASRVDAKIDDSLPNTGFVQAGGALGANNACKSDNSATGSYSVNSQNTQCIIGFSID